MAKATLTDIANKCGVSTATVSMVLSGKGSISSEMKEAIISAADELDYIPRASRKSSGPGFKNVCILQWEESPFLWHFSQPFVLKLEKLIVEEGLRPIILHCLPNLDNKTLYNEVKSAHAGAVFSINYVNQKLFDRLEENGIPVIVINNNNYQDRYWSVLADDIQGAYDGTSILIEMGHSRIGYLEYSRGNDAVIAERFTGFRLAMETKKLEIPDAFRQMVKLENLDDVTDKTLRLLKSSSPPTALFVHDDYLAAMVHTILRDKGVCVPDDMSIICPGDVLDYTIAFFPKLSTMQIDRNIMVRMAWDLLINRLDTESGKIRVLKTKLHYIDRGSCKPVKK